MLTVYRQPTSLWKVKTGILFLEASPKLGILPKIGAKCRLCHCKAGDNPALGCRAVFLLGNEFIGPILPPLQRHTEWECGFSPPERLVVQACGKRGLGMPVTSGIEVNHTWQKLPRDPALPSILHLKPWQENRLPWAFGVCWRPFTFECYCQVRKIHSEKLGFHSDGQSLFRVSYGTCMGHTDVKKMICCLSEIRLDWASWILSDKPVGS